MNLTKLEAHFSTLSIDELEREYSSLRGSGNYATAVKLQELIACFVAANDIQAVNTMSMLLAHLEVEFAPALIVGKLLSGQHTEEGGTLLYSLLDLDYSIFYDELKSLWDLDISFEMQNMLQLLDIPRE